jgi:glycosyltransferase involved in cell wall biosynthesis
MSIHLMHILTDTNIGGAGTLLCNQLRALDRRRFTVTVVLPHGSRLVDRIAAIPAPTRIVYSSRGADRSADSKAVGDYLRILRTHRPDIVHTHACLSARIAARIARIPVCLHTRHCVFPLKPWQQTGPIAPLYRLIYRTGDRLLSDGVIAVAEAAKQNLLALGADEQRIRVIVNGVYPLSIPSSARIEALRTALQLPTDAFVVGMVARLEPYKGHQTLLEAAARCLQASDRFYFLLLGDGSCADALHRTARELGISAHIRMVGFVEDVAPYYGLMNVNVNASYGTETSSLALSEGMSLGIPAVASTYGGNTYMVRDGVNGLLFPPHDSTALSHALLRLLQDEPLREQLSLGARTFFEQHLTARAMTEQVEAFYLELWQRKTAKKSSRSAML